MDTKKLFVAAFAALIASAPRVATALEWNHDPESHAGPRNWGGVTFPFATCGATLPTLDGAAFTEVGKRQSPVDIVGAEAAPIPEPHFRYRDTPFEIENTGHVIEIPYAPGSRLSFGLDEYELVQFHFHTPSEHTVNGRPSSMELHLVHRDRLGNLAVVGVLLEVGPNPNPLIEEIFAHAPLAEGTVPVEGKTLNARDLLPREPRRFWTYAGSLTTPPCSEGVRWTVLKTPVNVSQATVDRFHAIVGSFPGYEGFTSNSRPVAPLHGRTILSN
jgi:carbonic anhydrase